MLSRILALLLVAATVSAQAPPRRATNIAALLAFPVFYHGRSVLVVGTVTTDKDGQVRVSDGSTSLRVVFKGSAPDGNDEIRGEFWDLGRMKSDDPRLVSIDLRATFGVDPEGGWPRAGEATALMATAIASSPVPTAPSIRAIVLHPVRYLNQKVTISGQYAGRNLLGDIPDAPARSRWDFVIRSADAAIWVSGARPKGKGFDFALDSRLDSGRWLDITGIVHEGRGLQWIDVSDDGIQLGKAPPAAPAAEERPTVRVPAAPPPEVVFSAPTQDESDVPMAASVRIQFSRDIAPATLKGQIRAAYFESETKERGEPVTPTAEFTTQYLAANRVLELKFTKPLERFRTLQIDLQEGILGTDQQPLKPWTLTFVVGGS
ncbi:MAG: Ig-like domain-containing protein [Acidobacteriota bacterium]